MQRNCEFFFFVFKHSQMRRTGSRDQFTDPWKYLKGRREGISLQVIKGNNVCFPFLKLPLKSDRQDYDYSSWCFRPFHRNTCKSKLYIVDILETSLNFVKHTHAHRRGLYLCFRDSLCGCQKGPEAQQGQLLLHHCAQFPRQRASSPTCALPKLRYHQCSSPREWITAFRRTGDTSGARSWEWWEELRWGSGVAAQTRDATLRNATSLLRQLWVDCGDKSSFCPFSLSSVSAGESLKMDQWINPPVGHQWLAAHIFTLWKTWGEAGESTAEKFVVFFSRDVQPWMRRQPLAGADSGSRCWSRNSSRNWCGGACGRGRWLST